MFPYIIEQITKDDDQIVCQIIEKVGAEYGAIGEGFGPSDPEVMCMSHHYRSVFHSRYLVAKMNGMVIGGSGIAPFNQRADICELKKLFLLPESRGFGVGRALTMQCFEYAKSQGFSYCYLDTLSNMTSAIALYEKLGFKYLDKPLSGSEHNACDTWMLKAL